MNRLTKQAGKTVIIGCLASFLATSTSWATVEISLSGVNGVGGITSTAVHLDNDGGGPDTAFTGGTGWAGGWNATIISQNPNIPPPDPYDAGDKFLAFCTDIGNVMSGGTYTYEPSKFSSALPSTAEGSPPDPNWADGFSGQRAAYIYNTYIGSVNPANPIHVSAMAIAVWEALYEGGVGLAAGSKYNVLTTGTGNRFSVATSGASAVAAAAQANIWLAAGEAAGFVGFDLTWFAEREPSSGFVGDVQIAAGDVQSLVGPVNPVPEPTTYLAGALLMLPFLASTIRVWRRRQIKS